MNKSAFLLLALLVCIGLGACNTAEGFGKDVEGAGRKIQNTF